MGPDAVLRSSMSGAKGQQQELNQINITWTERLWRKAGMRGGGGGRRRVHQCCRMSTVPSVALVNCCLPQTRVSMSNTSRSVSDTSNTRLCPTTPKRVWTIRPQRGSYPSPGGRRCDVHHRTKRCLSTRRDLRTLRRAKGESQTRSVGASDVRNVSHLL